MADINITVTIPTQYQHPKFADWVFDTEAEFIEHARYMKATHVAFPAWDDYGWLILRRNDKYELIGRWGVLGDERYFVNKYQVGYYVPSCDDMLVKLPEASE